MDSYWYTHSIAMDTARMIARETGERQRVRIVNPTDETLWARFQIVAAVTEPCS